MIDLAAASRSELDLRLAAAQRHCEKNGNDPKIDHLVLLWEKICIRCGGADWPDNFTLSQDDLAEMAAETKRAVGVAIKKNEQDPAGSYSNERLRQILHIDRTISNRARALAKSNARAQEKAAIALANQLEKAA